MCKESINMVAIETKKANAQNLTCFVAFIAATTLAVILMIVACSLPVVTTVTQTTCWVSMAFEAAAICLGFISYWIKKHTL